MHSYGMKDDKLSNASRPYNCQMKLQIASGNYTPAPRILAGVDSFLYSLAEALGAITALACAANSVDEGAIEN